MGGSKTLLAKVITVKASIVVKFNSFLKMYSTHLRYQLLPLIGVAHFITVLTPTQELRQLIGCSMDQLTLN